MKRFVVLPLILLLSWNSAAQEAPLSEVQDEVLDEVQDEAQDVAASELPDYPGISTQGHPVVDPALTDTIVFYIRNIDFDIQGRTRSWALVKNIDLETGIRLRGVQSLETYIRRKSQTLRNQRVLNDTLSWIDYTIAPEDQDGLVPVDLMVHAVDTWNIIALPEPEYDSNSGLSLTLKVRNYNFLGTMSPLAFDLGYKLEDERNSALLRIDSDTPFTLFGYRWNLNLDNDITYTENAPLYYKNTTGLSMEVPWKETTFTFTFTHAFILNEETSDTEKDRYPYMQNEDTFPDTWYMSSSFSAGWSIPLLEMGEFGELSYNPGISESVNYRPGGEIGDYRRGPATTLSHSIDFGQINWTGNYRNGANISFANANTFNNHFQTWDNNISFTAIGHRAVSRFFGVSGRLQYRQWFNNPYFEAGDALRGIRDKYIRADYMISLNMEFPIRILRFAPSEWFNTRKLRLFDFEMHFSPFL
ncbi:MAG: hypothetical protein LBK64_05715, partial [Spirochaetaceae bacterium]|nr:hypothetical protein [Spirochaetaceae bacterium]